MTGNPYLASAERPGTAVPGGGAGTMGGANVTGGGFAGNGTWW